MAQRYVCVRRSVIRAGFEMDSEKAGTLEKGTVVAALEERANAQGITRVRFDGGWTSLVTGAGQVVLEEIAPVQEGVPPDAPLTINPAVAAAPGTGDDKKSYVCRRRAIVRAGFETDSDTVGTLEKNAVILAIEERENAQGTMRVRFADGWISLVTAAGVTVLEPADVAINVGTTRAAPKPDAPTEAASLQPPSLPVAIASPPSAPMGSPPAVPNSLPPPVPTTAPPPVPTTAPPPVPSADSLSRGGRLGAEPEPEPEQVHGSSRGGRSTKPSSSTVLERWQQAADAEAAQKEEAAAARRQQMGLEMKSIREQRQKVDGLRKQLSNSRSTLQKASSAPSVSHAEPTPPPRPPRPARPSPARQRDAQTDTETETETDTDTESAPQDERAAAVEAEVAKRRAGLFADIADEVRALHFPLSHSFPRTHKSEKSLCGTGRAGGQGDAGREGGRLAHR